MTKNLAVLLGAAEDDSLLEKDIDELLKFEKNIADVRKNLLNYLYFDNENISFVVQYQKIESFKKKRSNSSICQKSHRSSQSIAVHATAE